MHEKTRNALFFKPPHHVFTNIKRVFFGKSLYKRSFSSFILFFLSLLLPKVLLGKYQVCLPILHFWPSSDWRLHNGFNCPRLIKKDHADVKTNVDIVPPPRGDIWVNTKRTISYRVVNENKKPSFVSYLLQWQFVGVSNFAHKASPFCFSSSFFFFFLML